MLLFPALFGPTNAQTCGTGVDSGWLNVLTVSNNYVQPEL
jgi:hypothetical protein